MPLTQNQNINHFKVVHCKSYLFLYVKLLIYVVYYLLIVYIYVLNLAALEKDDVRRNEFRWVRYNFKVKLRDNISQKFIEGETLSPNSKKTSSEVCFQSYV